MSAPPATNRRPPDRAAAQVSLAWRWWLALGERLFGAPGPALARQPPMPSTPDPVLPAASVPIDSLDQAVMIADAAARLVAVNPAFSVITGFAADEVLQCNPRFLKSDRQGDAFYAALWARLMNDGLWQGEIWNRRKDGSLFPAWQTISVVRRPDGAVANFVSVFSDISALKLAEAQLRHLAHHDPLTDLPNRLLFGNELEHAIRRAQRHGQRLALLFIDLDDFKRVNDTLGHLAGDQLLRSVGTRLREAVRGADVVARLGGDEFTVVLEELASTDAATLTAHKLREAIGQPLLLGQQRVSVSASIGIALYPDDGADGRALIDAADAAMYRAKHGRRAVPSMPP